MTMDGAAWRTACEARSTIFEKASSSRQELPEGFSFLEPAFDQATIGFHALEWLPEGLPVRWMGPVASFRFSVPRSGCVLRLEFRGLDPQNRLSIMIDGLEVGEWEGSDAWLAEEVSLDPWAGRQIEVCFSAAASRQPTGDPRSLSFLFRRLDGGGPVAERIPQSSGKPDPSPPSWVTPDLPSLDRIDPHEEKADGAVAIVVALKYFRPRDAISEEARYMVAQLRQWGHRVEILAEQVHSALKHEVFESVSRLEKMLGEETGMIILHHGTPWEYGKRLLESTRARHRLLRYHNVTPPECFLNYPAGSLGPTIQGRFDTSTMVQRATCLLPVSWWAMGELVAHGADPDEGGALPYLQDLQQLEALEPDLDILAQLRRRDRVTFLVLGRQVPSKGLHHAIEVARFARENLDSDFELHFVGARDPLYRAYHDDLEEMVRISGLENRVFFREAVSRKGVVSYLRGCDALVTMSESDAASIPISEAGWLGTPVLGLLKGGKGELAGPGQLLFDTLDLRLHAEAWSRFSEDSQLRAALGTLVRQHVRGRFGRDRTLDRFRSLIDDLISSGGATP